MQKENVRRRVGCESAARSVHDDVSHLQSLFPYTCASFPAQSKLSRRPRERLPMEHPPYSLESLLSDCPGVESKVRRSAWVLTGTL